MARSAAAGPWSGSCTGVRAVVWVDHVPDAGDGQRSLRDVGGEHHAAPAVRLEHAVLLALLTAGAYIGSTSRPPAWPALPLVFQRVGGVADLPLTAGDEDVAGPSGVSSSTAAQMAWA